MTDLSVAERARHSRGASEAPIYRAVSTVLRARRAAGVLADIGCGSGGLWPYVAPQFDACVGVDAVRYDGLPPEIDFRLAELDSAALPLDSGSVDAAVAVETIEHLENPRRFCRELTRIVKPGGVVVVSTPNQRSVLSLLTLLRRGEYAAFGERSYPAHLTALLEIDLRRIFAECGVTDVAVHYSGSGRIPLTGRHYPAGVSRRFPRACSDNLVVSGIRAAARRS